MSPGSLQDGRLLVTQPLASLRKVMLDDCRQKPSAMFCRVRTALKSAKYNGLGMCVCVCGGGMCGETITSQEPTTFQGNVVPTVIF